MILVNWIKNLLNHLLKWSGKGVIRPVPEPILDSEQVTRYLTNRGHFNTSMVKQSAFLPNNDRNFGLSTSVFRTPKMSQGELELNKLKFEQVSKKVIKAAALVGVSDVQSVSIPGTKGKTTLSIVPEESDFRWHADIINWPEEKEKQKSIAIELAKMANLIKN